MPKKRETVKRYLIFCEPCSFKKVVESDKPEDMVLIKRSPVPGGSPRLDAATKQIKGRPVQEPKTMCKCPQCGRGATLKDLPSVYKMTFEQLDEQARLREEELEKQRRLEDGRPHERRPDPDFIG